jgi:phage terminase small subunit
MSDIKLTPKQDKFVQAYLETGNATEAYRRAYNVERMLPATINNQAWKLIKNPGITARLEQLQQLAVERTVLQKADVINLITEIATADATALSELQVRGCRHCWGVGHRYQWSTPIEYAFRCAEVMDQNAKAEHRHNTMQAMTNKQAPAYEPRDLPGDEGGYGFQVTRGPNPECPHCLGEGHEVVTFKDTRYLKGKNKRLFAGIKKTKDGIEIKTRNQDAALDMLAKIHGVYAPEQAPPPGTVINASGAVTVISSDPLEAARMYADLMKGG